MRAASWERHLQLRIALVVAAGVLATVVALGGMALLAFDRAVEPELNERIQLVASLLRGDLQQALELGVPLEAITGLEQHIQAVLGRFEEIERIAILASDGGVLAESRRALALAPGLEWMGGVWTAPLSHSLPLIADGTLLGQVRVETAAHFIQTRLGEMFLDVLVLALVAVVVAVMLVHVVVAEAVGKPLRRALALLGEQRDGLFVHRVRPGGIGGIERVTRRFNDHAEDIAERLTTLSSRGREALASSSIPSACEGRPSLLRLSDPNDTRLALFLFSVATEVSTAFMPLYARSLARPAWLSAELAASAPLLFYLLGLAATVPFAGHLSSRIGARRLFLLTVPSTALALVGMGISQDVITLTLWRLLLAVGYALAIIACQEYALRAQPTRAGGEALGGTMAVVLGGVFCGSALGGLLAQRFGYLQAFVAAALLLILAGILAGVMMRGTAGDADPRRRTQSTGGGSAWQLLRHRPRLLLLLFGIAMPMNLTTAVVVWYLTPLSLADQGGGPALIARVVMLYYLAAVLVGSLASRLADGDVGPGGPIILGGVLSIAALVGMTQGQAPAALALAMAALGLGHALLRGPVHAEVRALSDQAPRMLALLRLVDRLGALCGLLLCALWLEALGHRASLLLVVAAVAPGMVVYTVVRAPRGQVARSER
ncbi:MFS transporter [Halomonas sp.]|uniref:MFS transporter n=1 Tax=Halomonas sp. TaxID=1486246 RepID=UPI00298DDDF2|nr:MFS transporter [Halomonas sp.]MDW7747811.1 MFS transporter [Halomonas sp.]